MSEENIFERDLDQTVANHQTQTPLSFLAWAASVYPDKAAVIHGDKSYTYAEFYTRCRRLASDPACVPETRRSHRRPSGNVRGLPMRIP